MWIDDLVKKGFDKSLNFVKQVTSNDSGKSTPSQSPPIPANGGQFVMYTLREAPIDPHAPFPDACSDDPDENIYICNGTTVGEILHAFPVPKADGKFFHFRFKAHDEQFGHMWIEGLEMSDECPTVNGCVTMDVLMIPVDASKPLEVKANGAVESRAAPPVREELVKQRLEREAAQIQAARDFAEASAQAESERRQNKLDVQGSLGPELDRWAFSEPGKYKDVRSLLSSMESVLWLNSGWQTIAMGELMINDTAVKKLHRKAIILCHPDRHQQAPADQQYRADRIFNAINEAYKLYAQK